LNYHYLKSKTVNNGEISTEKLQPNSVLGHTGSWEGFMTRCSTNLERGDSRSGLSGKSRGPPAEVDSGDRSGGGQGGRGGGPDFPFSPAPRLW